ncbi:hypothetical protein [Synechococcus sp. CC9605]|uniref:hypothetical protein n=1 Tax=Synechococcus sp. (strain CC9605) TaxID=110662 RepID=UPI0018DDBC36|nr:hypothetical protein [Synechococcus sp. CC9605]
MRSRLTPEELQLSGDPPAEVGAGALPSQPVPVAGLGGGTTEATPMELELRGTAWQLVAGTDHHEHGEVESLEHLQHLLETSPEVAGSMLLGSIVRLRAALKQIPRDADADHPIFITATDAVLLSRSVMRGLR